MQAVILAGGLGTRLSEETSIRPKPMVEIGGMPILWHIMKIYHNYGVRDFIICCGYKGEVIKDFFSNYIRHRSSVQYDLATGRERYLDYDVENWNVSLINTGAHTMTGGRLKRVRAYLQDQPFFFTYGDGVSDVDLSSLVKTHKKSDALVTLTAVQPPGRFGALMINSESHEVTSFQEKPNGDGAWINGGFFVVEPDALDFIEGDSSSWETKPLSSIARERRLSAYRHRGFWQPMDTLRDRHTLESLWESNEAPWKVW